MGWDPNAPMLDCQQWSDMVERHEAELKAQRDHTIEECAKLVEGWSVPWQMVPSIAELAAAIRALKDKP